MFQKEWPVLVVDDDADVLAVSKLAMRDFKVNGLPVTLHTASSKAEAIELLNTRLSGALFPYVAVALIDVVMETDQAGLELCQYIRETLDNRMTQIFIRTGQPGVAPERQVMDRYDINGYFTKVEATEDKLYSIVKSGVREFAFVSQALGSFKTAMYAVRAQTPAELQAGTPPGDSKRVRERAGAADSRGQLPDASGVAHRRSAAGRQPHGE